MTNWLAGWLEMQGMPCECRWRVFRRFKKTLGLDNLFDTIWKLCENLTYELNRDKHVNNNKSLQQFE